MITFPAEHHKIVVISPKRNRKLQRDYDKEVYKMRHFVENVILDLKRWRGIAIWADYLVETPFKFMTGSSVLETKIIWAMS